MWAGNPYRVNQEWRDVGVRHVPVVWGILLAAKRVSFRPLLVEPSGLLCDRQPTFKKGDLPKCLAGCTRFAVRITIGGSHPVLKRTLTDCHHHELHAV